MNKVEQFMLLIKKAQNDENEIAILLSNLNSKELDEKKEINDLENYREEYHINLYEQGKKGTSGAGLASMHNFIMQIDQVIKSKLDQLDKIGKEKKKISEQYFERLANRRKLEKYVEKLKIEEVKKENKLEQKKMDELSLIKKKNFFD